MRRHSLFFAASPLRTALEFAGIWGSLSIAIALLGSHTGMFGLVVIGVLQLLGFFMLPFRLRFPTGPWWQQLGKELGAAALISVAVGAVGITIQLLQGNLVAPAPAPVNVWETWTSACITLLCIRLPLLAWRTLHRLQKRHLRWSLAYANLVFIIVVMLTVALLILGALLYFGHGLFQPTSEEQLGGVSGSLVLVVLLLLLFALVAATILVIAFAPAALISYAFTRQTTRRLEQLARSADALRAGELSARVSLQGEDEVAHLQTSFNSMAEALQRTLHDLAQANTALAHERDTVAKLLHERRALIANVSHELRTPLATLRGYLDSNLSHWDGVPPPTLRQDLVVMERETVRLGRLIDDLFTLARVEVGELALACTQTNLEGALRRSVEAVAPAAWSEHKVEVIADIAPDLPTVLADDGRVEQVIRNLLRNALRHTPAGGFVVLAARQDNDMLLIEVKDTGEGIAPEDLPHIFERFFRARNARERDAHGAGLGLALVKELVEAMGGTVAVESTVGNGACFSIRLPQANSVM